MLRLYNIEEIAICVAVPYPIVLCSFPRINPIRSEIVTWVAIDLRKHDPRVARMFDEVIVAFYGCHHGKEIFLKLQPYELLAPDIPHGFGLAGVRLIPSSINRLNNEINQAAIRHR